MDIKGTRKSLDCRKVPGSTCTLKISGTEDEVYKAGLQHAISAHGEKDTSEVRAMIRTAMEDDVEMRVSRPSGPNVARV